MSLAGAISPHTDWLPPQWPGNLLTPPAPTDLSCKNGLWTGPGAVCDSPMRLRILTNSRTRERSTGPTDLRSWEDSVGFGTDVDDGAVGWPLLRAKVGLSRAEGPSL